MNLRTKQYLRKRFGDYYRNTNPVLSPDFRKREWGFIYFDELPEIVMRRHKAFSSEGEALEYLRAMVPAHVYHSAAYYEFPDAATMKEKQWQGADLIFDLDADHLTQKAGSYKEMLANVKKEAGKLIKDFLLEDFGFSEHSISIAFSGGRGYHIHVRDPKVLTLESAERREIVDYLSGTGLIADLMIKSAEHKVYDAGKFKKKELESPRRISSFEDVSGGYGWGKRISQYIVHFLKEISSKDDANAINELIPLIRNHNLKKVKDGIPEDIEEKIIQMKKENKKLSLQKIADESGIPGDAVRDILIKNDLWDFKPDASAKLKNMKELAENPRALDMIENKGIIGDSYIFDAIVQKAIEDNSVNLGSAHTDEPVTADIRRLIRMPSSLHGGSGMKVVPLTLADFENFEPLTDAVVFSEKNIKVEVLSPLKPKYYNIEMKGKPLIQLTEGINTLPEYAAIYLMCQGAAEYA